VAELDPIVAALVAERKAQGLSQRAIGRACGLSSATACEWERGGHSPTLDNLRAWADALGLDLRLQPRQ
jgi:transcriptional regulator with XRE-family HTH domain